MNEWNPTSDSPLSTDLDPALQLCVDSECRYTQMVRDSLSLNQFTKLTTRKREQENDPFITQLHISKHKNTSILKLKIKAQGNEHWRQIANNNNETRGTTDCFTVLNLIRGLSAV